MPFFLFKKTEQKSRKREEHQHLVDTDSYRPGCAGTSCPEHHHFIPILLFPEQTHSFLDANTPPSAHATVTLPDGELPHASPVAYTSFSAARGVPAVSGGGTAQYSLVLRQPLTLDDSNKAAISILLSSCSYSKNERKPMALMDTNLQMPNTTSFLLRRTIKKRKNQISNHFPHIPKI